MQKVKLGARTDVELINMALRLVAERSSRVSEECRRHFESLGLGDENFPEPLERLVIDARSIEDITPEQADLCIARLKVALEINRGIISSLNTGEEAYELYLEELRDLAALWIGVASRLRDHRLLCGRC